MRGQGPDSDPPRPSSPLPPPCHRLAGRRQRSRERLQRLPGDPAQRRGYQRCGHSQPGEESSVSQPPAPQRRHLPARPLPWARPHPPPLGSDGQKGCRDCQTRGQRGGRAAQTHVSPQNHRGAHAPAPPLQGPWPGAGQGWLTGAPSWGSQGPEPRPPPQAHREVPAPPGTSHQPPSPVPGTARSPSPAAGTGTGAAGTLQTVPLNNARV